MSVEAATSAAGPVDPVGTDLTRILRALKLSGLKDTLPERLVTAGPTSSATPRSSNCSSPTS